MLSTILVESVLEISLYFEVTRDEISREPRPVKFYFIFIVEIEQI